MAVVVDRLQDVLDPLDVGQVAGADEEVVGDLEERREVLEALGVAVGELAGADAGALGRLRDGLAVLVGAGEEEDLLPPLAHVPGHDVGGDRGVRVPRWGAALTS